MLPNVIFLNLSPYLKFWIIIIWAYILIFVVFIIMIYYVEECAESDLCGLNTDLQLTNTTVKMNFATGFTWLEVVNI